MTREPSGESPRFTNKAAYFLPLLGTAALMMFVRLRLLGIPLERDEGEYAYGGQLLLDGFTPCQSAYSVKLPGTCATYAAMMGLFGQTPEGIHLGFLLVNLCSLALVYWIGRRLLNGKQALVAAISFALLSSSPTLLGLQGHATHLVSLFALGGIWLWLRAREGLRHLWLFFSGISFGLSFLCKQPGLFFGIFGVGMIVIDSMRQEQKSRRQMLADLTFYGSGLILPYAVTCLLVWRAGAFQTFWFWTAIFPSVHAGALSAKTVFGQFSTFFSDAGVVCAALTIAVAGMARLFSRTYTTDVRIIFVCLAICSLLSFSAGLFFTRHYFIVALPVVSFLVATAYEGLESICRDIRWIAPTVFATCCLAFISCNASVWFRLDADDVCRFLYGNNPFIVAKAVGKFIKDNSAPDARVAIFGSEPEIYFYAHRRSATGYIYMYDLVWRQKYAHEMQTQMIQEIESVKPEYVVMVNNMPSWMFWRDSDMTIVKWGNDYVQRLFGEAGAAYIYPTRSEYAWSAAEMKKNVDTPDLILLYKRQPGK